MRGGVRLTTPRLEDDVVQIFSRAPVYVPIGIAIGAWIVCLLVFPTIAVLGPFAALTILLAGLAGLTERRRRSGMLRRGRTLAGVQGLSWQEFEDLLGELFRREGYRVDKTADSRDGGVDHVLRRNGEVAFVQAKRWNQRQVSLSVVQRTYGVTKAAGAQRALVVTCGEFTLDAISFAHDLPDELELIDADELLRRLRAQGLADRITRPHAVPALPLPDPATASCPRCHADMVVRRGRRGLFLGCVRYPSCRGSRNFK